jgi:hypothetical protein
MSEGHELGIPTPALASDAQQQAPPGFENQQSGGEGQRPRRRGRPRPRGGARERERREKKERRERQQVTRSSYSMLLMACTSHSRT